MISVKNLTKFYKTPEKSGSVLKDFFNRKYKQSKALTDVSFEIGDNELVGFIGPNGAGKTTTMKILAGILFPSSGKVDVLGYTPFEKKPEFLRQISFVMGQRNQLLWELPPTDSFRLNKEIYEISDAEYKKTTEELIELLQCQEFIDQPVKTLSLGQRMRVEFIGALLHKPKVLFLDEPTIGLDIFAQTTIVNFIKEYQKRYDSTIILTSHYMKDVERLAKRVLLIDHGTMIFDGQLDTLVQKYSHEKTITIKINKPLKNDPAILKKVKHTYEFPEIKLTVKKDDLADVLPKLMKELDYEDVTIEDEPIEEIIKKTFKNTKMSS